MSITTDNVRQSPTPNKWQIGKLTATCAVLGACLLTFCTGALLIGKLGLDLGTLQTLVMVTLVFGGQALYITFANVTICGVPAQAYG
jgi:H+-transporting ATPase